MVNSSIYVNTEMKTHVTGKAVQLRDRGYQNLTTKSN